MIKLDKKEEINNPNNVKVVVDKNNKSLFFSRSAIPFNRSSNDINYYKHIGIYAFRNSFLNIFKNLSKLNWNLLK